MAVIEFHGVSKTYPGGTLAVDTLDLTIAEGEFMVFVGPSGLRQDDRAAQWSLGSRRSPTGRS